jgi:hypothetical protein
MIMFQDVVSPIIIIQAYGIHELLLQARIHIVHTLNMNVADVAMLCFNDNAHEMMVHMLMSCSYECTDARQTPRVLHKIGARFAPNVP